MVNSATILSCSKCQDLVICRTKPVLGCGNPHARLMLIGEAPGKSEDKAGRPFVGPAGRELEGYLRRNGIALDSCYVTNAVKCLPLNDRTPSQEELDNCSEYLEQEIAASTATVIGTLGAVASKALLGPNFSIDALHGILQIRKDGRRILPCLHPALGLHDTTKMTLIEQDFKELAQAVKGVINTPKDAFPTTQYHFLSDNCITPESLEEFYSIIDSDRIAIDTESKSTGVPWSIQLASRPGRAVVVLIEDSPTFLEAIKDVLQNPKVTTILHNAIYDLQVLNRLGITPSSTIDSMVAAYLLQDVPQSLKSLAYRIAGMKMKSYVELVSYATRVKALKYLKEALQYEWPDSDYELIWDNKPLREWVYEDKYEPCISTTPSAIYCNCDDKVVCERCKGLGYYRVVGTKRSKTKEVVAGSELGHYRASKAQHISTRIRHIIDSIEKSATTDPISLWLKTDPKTRKVVEACLGRLLPADLSDIDEKSALQYAAADADATLRVFDHLHGRIQGLGLEDVLCTDMSIIPMILDMQQCGIKVDVNRFLALSKEFGERLGAINKEVDDIACKHINPASTKQVQQLLFTDLRIPPDRKFRSKKTGAYSTGAQALQSIIDRHPIVPKLIEWRGLQKNKTAFADTLPARADTHSRIHPTIKTTRTTTGRLACQKPNLMAIPTRTEDGKKIRTGFIPDNGFVLVSADYSQIEMRVAADDSHDKSMCDAFIEGRDIHKQTASYMFGLPEDKLDEMKHRYPAKRVGFGVLYGLSPAGLLDQLNLAGCPGWNLDRCAEIIGSWFSMYSGIRHYFESKKVEARRYGYIRDRFGRIRLIPEVKSTIPPLVDAGYRQACSTAIQSGAQGIIKRAMVNLIPVYKQIGTNLVRPLIQIHDDLLFEVHLSVLQDWCILLKAVMESAVTMSIPLQVEIKIGNNWGNLKKEGSEESKEIEKYNIDVDQDEEDEVLDDTDDYFLNPFEQVD